LRTVEPTFSPVSEICRAHGQKVEPAVEVVAAVACFLEIAVEPMAAQLAAEA
jgi:hypothetical protein